MTGPWHVAFDSKWSGPGQVTFPGLQDWTTRSEPSIRFYSGTAVYRKQFTIPSSQAADRWYLDLGTVKNVAGVKLNNRKLGVIWTASWRVEITDSVRAGTNDLEIEIVNLLPNRLIGDGMLPREKRRTRTNVRTYDARLPANAEYPTYGCPVCEARRQSGKPAALLPSGLLGPVTVKTAAGIAASGN
jgi:hypothetical protein